MLRISTQNPTQGTTLEDFTESGGNLHFYRWVCAICCVLLPAVVLLIIRRHINAQALGMFEDDFFYYKGMARGYLTTGLTTFDGVTHTNGYHPVWQFIFVLLLRYIPAHFTVAVALTMALSSIATFLLSLRLLRMSSIPEGIRLVIAAIAAIYAWNICRGGMESNVGIPSLLLLAAYTQERKFERPIEWFLYGLLASFAILCRLDIILYVILLSIFLLIRVSQLRVKLLSVPRLLCLVAGFLPTLFYFGYNRYVFGAFLTVSAHAKQLKTGLDPYWPELTAIWKLSGLRMAYSITLIALCVYVGVSWRRIWEKPVLAAALLFPWMQLGILMLRSEYSLRPWYAYPAALSLPLGLAYIWERFFSRRFVPVWIALCAPIIVTVGPLRLDRFWQPNIKAVSSLAAQDYELYHFFQSHTGNVAMGDRAGVLGSLLPHGLVQLEGLTMDEHFVEELRDQKELLSVLEEHDIRYYVAQSPDIVDGCYKVVEPIQVGRHSPQMSSLLCFEPSFTIQHEADALKQNAPFFLGVFDLKGISREANGSWQRQP